MTDVITPPNSWKLIPNGSMFILDGDWAFPLQKTSEDPCEIYIYEVKGFPELIKVGITKDSAKRIEKYYGQLLWHESFNRRIAFMVEYLFMHSTYHRAHSTPPRWNVGNFVYDSALPVLKKFFDSVGHDTAGITEVRQMTGDEAQCTLEYIHNLLTSKDIFQAISTCGIKTFNGTSGIRSTITVKRDITFTPIPRLISDPFHF